MSAEQEELPELIARRRAEIGRLNNARRDLAKLKKEFGEPLDLVRVRRELRSAQAGLERTLRYEDLLADLEKLEKAIEEDRGLLKSLRADYEIDELEHLDVLRRMTSEAVARISDPEATFIPHGFFVYLLWGADADRPMYVGQSRNILSRLGSHMQNPERGPHVHSVQLLRCESKKAMDEMERSLIVGYQPAWNKVHNSRWSEFTKPVNAEDDRAAAAVIGAVMRGESLSYQEALELIRTEERAS